MTIRFRSWTFRILLIVVFAVLLGWMAVRKNVFAANLTASWSYNFDPQPGCSGTRLTDCIDHFEVGDLTNPQDFVLIQRVPNPDRAVGKVEHISGSFKYGPPFGQRTISVIAVAKGPKGERITSNPFAARATVTIRPGAQATLIF